MCEKVIPGTTVSDTGEMCGFAYFKPMMQATDGLTLSQVCSLTGLEPSTVQNWVKRGFVPHPVNKMYRERHLARILLINSLRDSMQIDRVGELFRLINGDTDDESDDIISEEKLYDAFCSVVSKTEENAFNKDEVKRLVREQTERYIPPEDKSFPRLRQALTVMAYAYASGLFKKKCEAEFQKLGK